MTIDGIQTTATLLALAGAVGSVCYAALKAFRGRTPAQRRKAAPDSWQSLLSKIESLFDQYHVSFPGPARTRPATTAGFMRELTVKIARDPLADVWVTWASEVPGLTAIDKTKGGLISQIRTVAAELLQLSRESSRLQSDRDGKYNVIVLEQSIDRSGAQGAIRSDTFRVTSAP